MSKLGDDALVGYLDISVRAERLLEDAGVRTVGDLRAVDLGKVGLDAKYHREAVSRALAKWDAGGAAAWAREESAAQVAAAREALGKLDAAERAAVFRDFGLCLCVDAVKFAASRPAALVGGLLGAALGLVLDPPAPRPSTALPRRARCCLACASGMHFTKTADGRCPNALGGDLGVGLGQCECREHLAEATAR